MVAPCIVLLPPKQGSCKKKEVHKKQTDKQHFTRHFTNLHIRWYRARTSLDLGCKRQNTLTKFKNTANEQLNLPQIDEAVLAYWSRENIFTRSVDERPKNRPFVFYEGPPSANGMPGIHHVMARTVKDVFCRYKTMQGYRVERKGGWDTHGLPVELKVEQELGITKEDIGTKVTIEEYNAKCRETVMRFKSHWDDLTQKMGYWVDLDNPYITFENDYIESVWHNLKQLWDKNLLYKGYTIQPYSPAAGTGLSSHELNQPGAYREVKDTTVVAQFKVTTNNDSSFLFDNDEEEVYLLAWTTTPWTLPSNTALTVGASIDYVKINTFNKYTKKEVSVVLAEALVSKWFTEDQFNAKFTADFDGKCIPARRVANYPGSQLVGIRYEQLIGDSVPTDGDAFKVISGSFVTTEDGTGIVHTAPSFGADDRSVAEENGIGSLTLVDGTGKMTDDAGPFAGRYVKNYTDDDTYQSLDVDIAIYLKENNRAFDVRKYAHSYPHCWRTDKPILYYPLDSWFVRVSSLRDELVATNSQIHWKPAHTGEGRFKKWLEEVKDWNLSRSRFWGIPLPIWSTASGEERVCIGSVEELSNAIDQANKALGLEQSIPEDLHRPYVDDVVLLSSKGEVMKRESEVIDVWFDSGSMPYAQWHYPFENKEDFDYQFPADFIAEGVDQTRGWFYTLHAISTMLHGKPAFKNVIANGLVQDKNGQKMSKRLGNAVDPFETLAKYGADATRWYMVTNAPPWDNLKFNIEGIGEVQRKFFGTLYNTLSFFTRYADIDAYRYDTNTATDYNNRSELDQWMLSVYASTVEQCTSLLDDYDPTPAGRSIQTMMIDQVSNWYVRRSRRRFWKGDMTEDKKAAYDTLFEVLLGTAKLMAPIAPFYAEWMYDRLSTYTTEAMHDSVHLSSWPDAASMQSNQDLMLKMHVAQRLSSMVLGIRKAEKIRVRQPLSRILVPLSNEVTSELMQSIERIIQEEVNVKALELMPEDHPLMQRKAKANFKTLGRRLGKKMKATAACIAQLDSGELKELQQNGSMSLTVEGEAIEITEADVEWITEDIKGWSFVSEGNLSVALDVEVTEELRQEGLARELINRFQNLRKSSGLELTDRIDIFLEDSPWLKDVMDLHKSYIFAEILADTVHWCIDGVQAEVEIDEYQCTIGLKKTNS